MYKVEKKLSADRRYYENISCDELFTVSIDANKRSDTFIGRDNEGNLYYVEEEEAHSGNAYFMAKEFYIIDEVELTQFIDKAYSNGHISRFQRDRYRCGDFCKQQEQPPVFAEDIWYCSQCGAKHTKGKFCTQCGAERTKRLKAVKEQANKQPSQTKILYAERVSVSMGDDCHAPHRCPLEYEENTLLSEFMPKIADYVPHMHNFTWEIVCDLQTLGYLIFDDKANWSYELAVEDTKLELLLDKHLDKELYAEPEIFCRKHSMYDNMLLLKLTENKILFVYNNERYWLTSHPYEPCMYIKHNGLVVCILHNAFDVYDLPKIFASEEKIRSIDGKLYDEEAFLKVLAAAIDSGHKETNFTDAAKLVDK